MERPPGKGLTVVPPNSKKKTGYTNPRYPTRPKDIHLENLEKKKKNRCEVFTTDTPALEALLPLIGKPPRHGLVDL